MGYSHSSCAVSTKSEIQNLMCKGETVDVDGEEGRKAEKECAYVNFTKNRWRCETAHINIRCKSEEGESMRSKNNTDVDKGAGVLLA